MASIVGSNSYGEGHKVVLKDSTQVKSADLVKQLKSYNYKLGETVFSITKGKLKADISIAVTSTGTDKIMFKDPKNKVVMFVGSASAINNIFNHFSENAKSKTGALTELKEIISMHMFKHAIESNKILKEDELLKLLDINDRKNFDKVYYESALKQTKALKSMIKTGGYHYERQAKDKTKSLYEVGRKLSGKGNDNWNPADVWMIKNGFDMAKLCQSKTIDQLNEGIAAAYKKKQLIPISLKQVTNPTAKISVIDPASMMNQPLEYDVSFEKVDLSDTFNNFILQTKSGFAVRAGFKASATTLNVSLEGRFVGAGYQLGAIDASTFPKHIQTEYAYTVRGSKDIAKTDYDKAEKELKAICDKYSRISNTLGSYKEVIDTYKKGNKLTKERFANLISYMYALLVAPPNPKSFKELMTYCYYSSKKLVNDASMYVIIQ